jgi:DNA-binding response OmpR family regulator
MTAGSSPPSGTDNARDGPRVFLVEDEFLVSLSLEQDLSEGGYTVVGPFADLQSARQAAASETFDLALLDVNVNGERIYPLADELAARGVPIVLLTGYGVMDLPERFRAWPRVAKPHSTALLLKEIERVLSKNG